MKVVGFHDCCEITFLLHMNMLECNLGEAFDLILMSIIHSASSNNCPHLILQTAKMQKILYIVYIYIYTMYNIFTLERGGRDILADIIP